MKCCQNSAGLADSTKLQRMGQDRTLMVMEVNIVKRDEYVDQKEFCLRCLCSDLEDKGESDVDLINGS